MTPVPASGSPRLGAAVMAHDGSRHGPNRRLRSTEGRLTRSARPQRPSCPCSPKRGRLYAYDVSSVRSSGIGGMEQRWNKRPRCERRASLRDHDDAAVGQTGSLVLVAPDTSHAAHSDTCGSVPPFVLLRRRADGRPSPCITEAGQGQQRLVNAGIWEALEQLASVRISRSD